MSPQPRVAGEAITTTMGSQLAVKVEGIVQVTSSQRSSGRRVRAVQVTIQSNPTNPAVGPDGKVKTCDLAPFLKMIRYYLIALSRSSPVSV